MNESIRTDFREFFNRLERDDPGIKYNGYKSMTKVSKVLRSTCRLLKSRNVQDAGTFQPAISAQCVGH